MKKILVKGLGLRKRLFEKRKRLFEKISHIKSARYPALSVWLGIYGGELPDWQQWGTVDAPESQSLGSRMCID